ncbi:IBR domain protein [Ancylostoma ceylanicum]|uniref:RBR-type E3 ubiquitin transferase n=1 Tax=Ancylostoma ceylanicum TaxID=53326 RepID=A0A0D6L5M0_9BILA|nr:IBR domain protein [Ancylostoma ceylanicum]
MMVIQKVLSARIMLERRSLVGGRTALIEKYEQFSLRRYLMTEADARWCPAPDCGYAVIASSCAACPQLKCERASCGTLFCYHCKGVWHPSQTCDEARRQRGAPTFRTSRRITSSSLDIQLKRMFHPISPTGCTFWGKKPWTRKKKLLWQLGRYVSCSYLGQHTFKIEDK